MPGAVLPSIKDRLVFPLVILAAEDKAVFYPDEILLYLASGLLQRRSEIQTLGIR